MSSTIELRSFANVISNLNADLSVTVIASEQKGRTYLWNIRFN